MKVTVFKPKSDYRVFRGEFSGQWVGTEHINGSLVHSVQRSTSEAAHRDIQQSNPHAPRFVLGSSFY